MEVIFGDLTHWNWFIIGLILIVLEVFLPSTFFLWMAIGAVLVGTVLLIEPALSWELQLTIFALFSLISIVLSRYWLGLGSRNESTLSQRGDHYVGNEVVVVESITNGRGKVSVDDTLWLASGPDTAEGERVRVTGVSGVTLLVERS